MSASILRKAILRIPTAGSVCAKKPSTMCSRLRMFGTYLRTLLSKRVREDAKRPGFARRQLAALLLARERSHDLSVAGSSVAGNPLNESHAHRETPLPFLPSAAYLGPSHCSMRSMAMELPPEKTPVSTMSPSTLRRTTDCTMERVHRILDGLTTCFTMASTGWPMHAEWW